MKIPLKLGLALLVLLLVGISISEGPERWAQIMAAIGVALWSAFSLPPPPPRLPEDEGGGLHLESDGEDEEMPLEFAKAPDIFAQAPPPDAGNGRGHSGARVGEESGEAGERDQDV